MIPFFGPYIGAIHCIILIGLADPLKGLYFAIFILLLQQLDWKCDRTEKFLEILQVYQLFGLFSPSCLAEDFLDLSEW